MAEEAASDLSLRNKPLNLLQHLAPLPSNATVFVLEPAGLPLACLLEANARWTLATGESGISEPRALALVVRMLQVFAILEQHGLSMSVIHASHFSFEDGQHRAAEDFLGTKLHSVAGGVCDEISAFDASLKLVCLETCTYHHELDAAKRSAAFVCKLRPSEAPSSVATTSAEAAAAFRAAAGRFCQEFLQQCCSIRTTLSTSSDVYLQPSKLGASCDVFSTSQNEEYS